MRHKVNGRKLNRSGAHRKALGRNLFRALITHHRIETTPEKAKHYRPMAEKLITLANGSYPELNILEKELKLLRLVYEVFTQHALQVAEFFQEGHVSQGGHVPLDLFLEGSGSRRETE